MLFICFSFDGTFIVASTAIIIYTVAITSTTVVSTAVAGNTTLKKKRAEKKKLRMNHLLQSDPFAGSKLGAELGSSFSFPSSFCGYQSRACFCTP